MEKTKKAIGTLLKLANKVIADVKDDGKIDFGEAMGLAISGVGLIGIFKDLPEIQIELKGIDAVGVSEIVEAVKADFDLADDVLEAKIEAGLEVLAQMLIMVFGKQE